MKKLQLCVVSGATLASLALTLCMALGPAAPLAKAQWASGTWDDVEKTCTCPTWYNGCKCVISQ